MNKSTIEILNLVDKIRKRNVVGYPIELTQIKELLVLVSDMDVHSHRIDLGKLGLLCSSQMSMEPGVSRTFAITKNLIELHNEVS